MISLKFRRSMTLLVLFLLIPGMLTGCNLRSGLAAARLGATLQKNPITGMVGVLISTVEGETAATSIRSDFRVDWEKTGNSFWEADNEFQVLGLKIPQKLQAYGRKSGEEKEYFVHLETPGLWSRIPVSGKLKTLMEPQPGLILLLAEQAGSRASLIPKENIEGSFSALEFVLNGQEILELMRQGGIPIPKELIHFDFRMVSIPVSLTVNEDSWLPESMTLSLQGLEGEEARALLKAYGIHTTGKTEKIALELSISRFHFGDPDIPGLPQGAVEKAVDLEALRKALKKLFP